MKVKRLFEEKNRQCTECKYLFDKKEGEIFKVNKSGQKEIQIRCPKCKRNYIKKLNIKDEKVTKAELEDAKKKMDSLKWLTGY